MEFLVSSHSFDDFLLEDLDYNERKKECLELKPSEPQTILSVDPLALLPVDHPPEYYLRERTRKRRRRRATNPSFMPEIRVYRRDIRRKYSEMFLNVINNHDLVLLGKFIDEFFRPECQVIQVTPLDNEFSKVIEQVIHKGVGRSVSGLKEFLYACALNLEMRPDTIVRPQEAQVRVRQGYRGSVVVTKSLMKGTLIMTVQKNPRREICKYQMPYVDSLQDEYVPSYELYTDPSCSQSKRRNADVPWTPVIPPVETIGEMIFLMTLDESNQVQQFHLEYHAISEKPVTYTI
mmetsp:Transcript_20258/g.22003  ORF Transcript_20258/g.22003 Transcript_20258/m.22003 type:complete len:291 (-) Transcript_20258:120-992(-)